jgi:hypothetical protein
VEERFPRIRVPTEEEREVRQLLGWTGIMGCGGGRRPRTNCRLWR